MNPTQSYPPPAPPGSDSDYPQRPRRGGGPAWLALLVALAAAGGAGYIGWQQHLAQRSDQGLAASLQSRVDDLGTQLAQLRTASGGVEQKLAGLSQRDQASLDQVQGVDQRVRGLESAVARISEQTLSAHDSLVLDQVDSLLQTAQQRVQLFHDLGGALSAYDLAGAALTQLGNPQFDGVRGLLGQERAAVLKSQPQAQHDALDVLSGIRQGLPNWTLKPRQDLAQAPAHGIWNRIWAALSGVVSVQHEQAGAAIEQDPQLLRQIAELDVVEAEAALLADDVPAYRQALARVRSALGNQFDASQGEVSHAQASIALLIAHANDAGAPNVGGALAALRDLRRVQAVPTPAAAASASAHPAPASSGSRP